MVEVEVAEEAVAGDGGEVSSVDVAGLGLPVDVDLPALLDA